MITFTITGKPVPQERRGVSRYGRAYDPKKSKDAKEVVYVLAKKARPAGMKPSERSFTIAMAFYGPHWGADVDNLAKLVMDAIKGVFWVDDHQVTGMHARKLRCAKGQECTVVEITELTPEALIP